jgi:flagellar hook-length control protein FliK
MTEQGIKIEAVEVTVSAHAFERNLNEGGEERGGQSEAEAKKKKVRGINLTDADLSDLEDLDEEDKVTADMMARQGNTVDYMA